MSTRPYPPTPEISPQRRLCLAADMEQYSRLETRTQTVMQADLVRVLDKAATLTGLDRAAWIRQPQGDQELAVLPDNTPEASVLGPFVRHLAAQLAFLNAHRSTAMRMRLRLAVDIGVVEDAALGHAGPAPVAVARYLNAPQLKFVLASVPSTDLVAIVSDRLYQDVVRLGNQGLDPSHYVRTHIRVKEFGNYGWIHVPGHSPDAAWSGAGGSTAPQSPPCTPGPSPARLSQHVNAGVAVGRDVTGGVIVGLPRHIPLTDPRYTR
ncbi:hypothetical protein [Streptomyces monomycini]|uniref:hypothetical protein n=1 Tax=Streptomyces monomycini TaxID=371720 RepID=UPI0004AA367C|nr:hypothetical protein [Streptomyces monomycini]